MTDKLQLCILNTEYANVSEKNYNELSTCYDLREKQIKMPK